MLSSLTVVFSTLNVLRYREATTEDIVASISYTILSASIAAVVALLTTFSFNRHWALHDVRSLTSHIAANMGKVCDQVACKFMPVIAPISV